MFDVADWLLQDSLAAGSFVLWVQSTVADANSTVHYRLVVTSSALMTPGFSVDRDSGIVSTATVLDAATAYSVSERYDTIRYEMLVAHKPT